MTRNPIHLCSWGEQCPEHQAWFRVMRRRVRVWDNGGKTVDRFTVVIYRQKGGETVADVYGMSDNPLAPDGFNQFSHTTQKGVRDHFGGVRIKPQDLPKDVITAIEQRL